jgi:hypothetical protein
MLAQSICAFPSGNAPICGAGAPMRRHQGRAIAFSASRVTAGRALATRIGASR